MSELVTVEKIQELRNKNDSGKEDLADCVGETLWFDTWVKLPT